MSKFDDLFHPKDDEAYRQRIRRKIESSRNSAKNARNSVSNASDLGKLGSYTRATELLLLELMEGVPSKLNDDADSRLHKVFMKARNRDKTTLIS